MMNTKNVLAKLGMTVTVFLIAFSFTLFANEDSTTSSGETPDVIEGVEIDGDTSQTTDGASLSRIHCRILSKNVLKWQQSIPSPLEKQICLLD